MTVPENETALDEQRLFGRCSLFRAFDESARRQLASRAHRRRFAAGDVIFRAGSPGQTLVAVLTGTVRILVRSPQGKEIVLADLPPGEIVGEIAVLDGKERTADAVALTNCELLVLERRDILAALERHPSACLKLLELLCERLRRADEQITDIAFFDLPLRLAKVLLRTAIPARAGEGRSPKVALSQRELGSMVGGTRESVNRCLRDWQRRGLVDLREGWIVLLAPAALEEIAALD